MTREGLIKRILEAAPRVNLAKPKTDRIFTVDPKKDPAMAKKRIDNVLSTLDPTTAGYDSIKQAALSIPSTARFIGSGLEGAAFVTQVAQNKKQVHRVSGSPERRGTTKRDVDVGATPALDVVRAKKAQVELVPYRDMGDKRYPGRGLSRTALFWKAHQKGKMPLDLHAGNMGVSPRTKQIELVDPGFVRRLTPTGKKIAHKYYTEKDPTSTSTNRYELGLRAKLNQSAEPAFYQPSKAQDVKRLDKLVHGIILHNQAAPERRAVSKKRSSQRQKFPIVPVDVKEELIEAIMEAMSPDYFQVEAVGTLDRTKKMAFMVTDNYNIYVGASGHPTMLRGRDKHDMMGGGWLDLRTNRLWFVSGSLGRFPRHYQTAVQGALENYFRRDLRVMKK